MVDFELLKEQNPWWIAREKIGEDITLEKLSRIKYIWHPQIDVIYTLRGSRQIGKTTTLSKTRLNDALLRSKLVENLVMFSLIKLENSVYWSNKVLLFQRKAS